MTLKQVQRYIKLNDLVPDLMKMMDEKKFPFRKWTLKTKTSA
jgi:ParB family transcriptional regulator, chromosome partitioning protein